MQHPLTIVMYHYVRPLSQSAYPKLKALDLDLFIAQLDFIERHYRPVDMKDVLAACRGEANLPECAVLLTFDDGYADHWEHVFPILHKRHLSGIFFPPSRAIAAREILDVNKVHFILAAGSITNIIHHLEAGIEDARGDCSLPSLEELRREWRVASRFDTADVIYVKRLLQHVLPRALRADLTSRLFSQFVSADERAFADELYVTSGQLTQMIDGGMHVGSHGHEHFWLDRLPAEAAAADIERSLDFLESLGVSRQDFAFCYPYGAFNDETIRILTDLKCGAAFTTQIGLAQPRPDCALSLPRLDTNDLPKRANDMPNRWTRVAAGEMS